MALQNRLKGSELTAIVVATLIAIVGSSVVAARSSVPAGERSVLEFVNGWPDWLELPMWALQQPGVLFAPVIIGAGLIALTVAIPLTRRLVVAHVVPHLRACWTSLPPGGFR